MMKPGIYTHTNFECKIAVMRQHNKLKKKPLPQTINNLLIILPIQSSRMYEKVMACKKKIAHGNTSIVIGVKESLYSLRIVLSFKLQRKYNLVHVTRMSPQEFRNTLSMKRSSLRIISFIKLFYLLFLNQAINSSFTTCMSKNIC